MSDLQTFSIVSPNFGDSLALSTAALARFYMSSDLRAIAGISRTHLDFYLRERLIRPAARTESGYLLFDERELAMLQSIVSMRRDGVPLRVIRNQMER